MWRIGPVVAMLACHRAAEEPKPTVKQWTTTTERATAPAMTLYGLASDGEALYWRSCPALGAPCTLLRLAHDATAPVPVLTAPGLLAFAFGDRDVVAAAGRQVLRVAKTGGAATAIETDLPIYDLAIDGDVVYATIADNRRSDGANSDPHAGRLVRFATTGGAVATLATLDASMPHLAVDAARVYVTGDHGVLAIPREGGEPEELAHTDGNAPRTLAVDDAAVYFGVGGEVRRVAKSGGAATVLYKAQIILDVRGDRTTIYAARNLAFDRGSIAERAAIVTLPAGTVTELDRSPQSLAVDGGGVYALLVDLRDHGPDRIVAFPR